MSEALDTKAIQDAIRRKYSEVARSAEGTFRYATGRVGAEAVGYDRVVLASLSDDVLEPFCGVGNPFGLGSISAGEQLLDVGCGAGVDLIVASRLVGARGEVHGIDLTDAMVEKARITLARAAVSNGRVQVARAEAIPYEDATFDVVVSNGALNLSPAKEEAFAEIYRVLRPHGRLQFADIVLREERRADVANSLDAWVG